MEAYKIWAALNIKGDAIEKMKIFQESIRAANYNLSLLNVNLDKFARNLAIVSPAFSNLAKSFGVVNKEATSSSSVFSRYDGILLRSSINTEKLSQKTAILTERLREAKVASEISFGGMGGIGSGAVAGAAGGAIRGGKVSKTLMKAAGHKVGSPGYMMGVGALGGPAGLGAMVAAYAGYSALHSGFESKKEYTQAGLQLSASGLNDSQLGEARSLSFHGPKGTSPTEMLKVYNATFMASRDWKEAKILAPELAKAEFGIKAAFGKEMTQAQMNDLMKFAEMRSGSDMSRLIPELNLGVKLMSASGFSMKPNQLSAFMRRATSAASGISIEGMAALEPIMQELTGTSTGTGLQTGWQMIFTGAGTLNQKKRVAHLTKMKMMEATYDNQGRPLSTTFRRDLKDLYLNNPVEFTKKVNSIYKAHGIKESMYGETYGLDFPNTTSRLLNLINKNLGKSDKELELFKKQLGTNALYKAGFDTEEGSSMRFSAASKRLSLAFGTLTSPGVIGGMNAISTFMEKLASLINLFNSKGFSNQMGNISMLSKKQPIIGAYSGFIHDPLKLKGYDGYGNYSKSVLGMPDDKSENKKMSGDVYLDNKKVGKVVYQSFADRLFAGNAGGAAISGITGNNGLMSPGSSALINYGGP